MKKNTANRNQLAMKGGSYSLAMTAVVLALLIVANIFVSAMPTTMTKYDISASKLYSITSNTKVVVNNLKQDVTLYWVVQADAEDQIIENLLGKYESLSSHIDVVKKNPDVFPTFTEAYTDEEVPNNSIIVESGDRYRYIDYYEIYETEYDYYSYTYVTSGFDGEGAITSAIDYCVTADLPRLYVLEGHGEGELPGTFADSLEKENVVLDTLSLLTVDAVPEEADALMIYAPQRDISEAEAAMLADYTANGGKLLVIAGPVAGVEFTNLNSLLADYGVTMNEGIVIEGSRENYTGYPEMLLPNLESHSITDPLIEDRYYAVVPLSQGMTVGSTSNGTVSELMYTSGYAFSKVAGFELDTYEYEEGDIEGPFTIALTIDTNGGGQIVWFSASDFLDDMYNAYSSGANVDLAMNAVSSLLGEREAISIRSKSLNYNYLTISEDTASTLKLLMIGVFPLAYLCIGIFVILSKRGKQNEAV